MSGGHFGYSQYKIRDIQESLIESLLNPTEYQVNEFHRSKTEFREFNIELLKAIKCLKDAETYAQSWDYLLSGDDGFDSYKERVEFELKQNEEQMEFLVQQVEKKEDSQVNNHGFC